MMIIIRRCAKLSQTAGLSAPEGLLEVEAETSHNFLETISSIH